MNSLNPVIVFALIFMALAGAAMPAFADGIRLPGKLVTTGELERQRGGHETQVFNDMDVTGTVTNNTATRNVTGHNIISNSFTSASGLPIVVQNSGNNVLIQNATIVNLEMH